MAKVKEEVKGEAYYKEVHFLYEILNSLKDVNEIKSFFKDMLTTSELIMLKRRWHVATLLYEGMDIREVAQETHTSTATVERIKNVLDEGFGGLLLALQRAKKHEKVSKEKFLKSKSTHGGSNFVKGWLKF